MRIYMLVMALVLSVPVMGQGVRYGLIKGEATARAGADAAAAEVKNLASNSVVEIVSTRGPFTEVRLPEGFSVFASETWKGNPALRLDGERRAIVLIGDLPMRVAPQATAISLGNFRRNASLRVLKKSAGGWLEVLAPRNQSLFVASENVVSGGDQASLARQFAARVGEAEARDGTVVAVGEAEGPGAEARAALRSLEARYDEVLVGEKSAAELGKLRGDYEALARKSGPDTEVGRAATSRATYLRRRERIASSIENANRSISRLEGQLGEAETGYEEDLLRLRRERRERLVKGTNIVERPKMKARFLEHGIGRLYPDFGETVTNERGVFVLTKAGERRYRVISDRYDLGEYRDKKIGITKWTILEDGSKSPWPKVLIDRMEVLR